jgi:pSer/pThr/pTyr-binding forkhead associated (FHA) protein
MAELVVRSDGEERVYRLEEDSVVIGRAPGCALQIDDIHSSRRHAQVIRVKGGFEVVDLKSRNGILVNGKKVPRQLLRDGDVVKIGEVEIVYQGEGPAAPEEDGDGIVFEDVGEDAAASPSLSGACSLRFRGGDRDGEEVSLTADRTTIGRTKSNTVPVKDQMVSSYHCEITREGGGYILRDLGSTNGTVVNGEPVTEVALNHGARIRVGGTSLLFVDPSMAALDASLDEADDAGEWGMMREIDASAVPRRRARLGLPIGLLVLVGAIVGGYVVLTGEEVRQRATVTAPEGNILPSYSFEYDGVEPELSVAGGSVRVVRSKRSGETALRLTRGDRPGPVVASLDAEDVDEDELHKLTGWIRCTDDSAAGLRLSWRLGGGIRTRWISPSAPVVGGGGWRPVELEISPPPDASEVTVQLVLLRGDSAEFDDVALVAAGASREPVRVRSGDFEVVADDCGCLGIQREDDWVAMNGGVRLLLADGRVLDSRDGMASLEAVKLDGAAIAFRGSLADLAGGDAVPFTVTVTGGEGDLRIAIDTPAERAGLSFTAARNLLDEPIYVQGPDLREARSAPFDRQEGLERITFGVGWQRLGAAAAPEGPSLAAELVSGGGEYRLTLDAPVVGGSAKLLVRTSFDEAGQEAVELLARARRRFQEGKDGEAYRLCEEIGAAYSFREGEVRMAADLTKKIKERLDALEAEMNAEFAAGRDFLDGRALRRGRAAAETLALAWGDEGPGKRAGAVLDEIDALLAAKAKQVKDETAGGELARARDFRLRDMNHLAAAVYRSIVERFDGTPAAAEARQALEELRQND